MIRSTNRVYPFYILVDLIFICATFLVVYILRYNYRVFSQNSLPYYKNYTYFLILWTVFIVTSLKKRNLYCTDRSLSIPTEIFKVITSVFDVSLLMATIIFFAKYQFFSRQIFLLNFCLLCFSLSIWRVIKRLILRKLILEGFHNINVLIIGAGNIGKIVQEEIGKVSYWGFKVVGFLDNESQGEINNIPILGKLKEFPIIAKKYFIDEVIISISLEKTDVSEIMVQAKNLNVGVRIVPENFEESVPILDISRLGIIPLLTYKERKRHPSELFLKRLFDFVASLILIILLCPLFVILSILIKLDSPGSAFFVQKRIGLKRKGFNLYKFRSMTEDADRLKTALLEKNEVKDGIIFKIKKDPRVTKLGAFLRRYSLDEFPQLFNVLKGDMSLVGPRPPTPEEVEKYNHFHMDRLSIRPGITGLSQVKARSTLTFRKWVRLDLWYIHNWSFMLDLQILLWTIPIVIKGDGAY